MVLKSTLGIYFPLNWTKFPEKHSGLPRIFINNSSLPSRDPGRAGSTKSLPHPLLGSPNSTLAAVLCPGADCLSWLIKSCCGLMPMTHRDSSRATQGTTGPHRTPQGTTGHHRAPQGHTGHHRATQRCPKGNKIPAGKRVKSTEKSSHFYMYAVA